MKKNNKGFTLIELLAVIVVLAIIMVIATQQVNGTIKKSRGNSFLESAQSIKKAAETVCAQDNAINEDTLKDAVNANDVTISVAKKDDNTSTVTVSAEAEGKFDNAEYPAAPKGLTKVEGKNAYSFDVACPCSGSGCVPKSSTSTSTN